MEVRITYTGGRSKRVGSYLFKQGVLTTCTDPAVIARARSSPDFSVLEAGQTVPMPSRSAPRPRRKVTFGAGTSTPAVAAPRPPKVEAAPKPTPDPAPKPKPVKKKAAKKAAKEEKKRVGLFRRRAKDED